MECVRHPLTYTNQFNRRLCTGFASKYSSAMSTGPHSAAEVQVKISGLEQCCIQQPLDREQGLEVH